MKHSRLAYVGFLGLIAASAHSQTGVAGFKAIATISSTTATVSTPTRTGVTGYGNSAATGWTETFQGKKEQLTGFTTGAGAANTFASISGISSQVEVRRATPNTGVTAPQRNTWYALNGDSTTTGVYDSTAKTANFRSTFNNTETLETIFGSNDLNRGVDNLFSNDSADSQGNFSNIERIDVIFPNGIDVRDAVGFNIFERHATGVNHDDFRMAAILSLGNYTNSAGTFTNAPKSFGTVYTATNSSFGADVLTTNYAILRDGIATGTGGGTPDGNADHITNVSNQQLGGVYIPTTALVNAGASPRIYGFSLFPTDVTNLTSAALLDWTDTANYSRTSAGAGANGLDPSATMTNLSSSDGFGATVPEPAGVLLALGALPALGRIARRRKV